MLDIVFLFISVILEVAIGIFKIFWPIIIPCVLIGIPVFFKMREKYWNSQIPDAHFMGAQEPAIFYNSYGHLVKVDSDPEQDQKVNDYFIDAGYTEENFRNEYE